MLPKQPFTVSVPLPLATRTPLQRNWKSPVAALINAKFPAVVSSFRQKLYTVTGKVQVAVLFGPPVAVQVTVVVPTGNLEAGGGLQATGRLPQLPVATGVEKLTAAAVANGQALPAARAIGGGHPFGNTGCAESVTVTVA